LEQSPNSWTQRTSIFIYWFSHPFSKYVPGNYYIPGTLPGATVGKGDIWNLSPLSTYFLVL
jgi:hypothetical protein